MNMVTLCSVTQLWLGYNKLSEWPPALFAMTQLTGLSLFSNQLRCVPSNIKCLKSLEWLRLDQREVLATLFSRLSPDAVDPDVWVEIEAFMKAHGIV